MGYLPARVTSDPCENCRLGRGSVVQFSAPGSYGVSKDVMDTKPEGYSAYYCCRCGFVWFKKPRRTTGMIPVGFWNSNTKTFTAYSPA
jgi:hypothetical protein